MTNSGETGVSDNLVFRTDPIIGWGGFWFQSLGAMIGEIADWKLGAYGVTVTVAHSSVDISYKGNTLDLQNLSLDVTTGTIDAKITVDGFSTGEVPLLKLNADGDITLTKASAGLIDMIAGKDLVSANTVINLSQILSGLGPWGWPIGIISPPIIARPMPIIDPVPIHRPIPMPIIIDPYPFFRGGETLAVLPGLKALQADGFKMKALGSAHLESFAGAPALLLPITGGFEMGGGDTTLHSGSGVEFSYKGSSLDLTNFLISDASGTVKADVTVAGHKEGLETILDISKDGALTLSAGLARLIDDAVGSNVVNSQTVIGGAYSVPLVGWAFEPLGYGPAALSGGGFHPG